MKTMQKEYIELYANLLWLLHLQRNDLRRAALLRAAVRYIPGIGCNASGIQLGGISIPLSTIKESGDYDYWEAELAEVADTLFDKDYAWLGEDYCAEMTMNLGCIRTTKRTRQICLRLLDSYLHSAVGYNGR